MTATSRQNRAGRSMALRIHVADAARSLSHARTPRQVHHVIIDLLVLFYRSSTSIERSLAERVCSLLRRARIVSVQLCTTAVLHCADLVDVCVDPDLARPAYDSMAQAVRACDDAWPFLSPVMQLYYRENVRKMLVTFLADSGSSQIDSADAEDHSPRCSRPDHDASRRSSPRPSKRLCTCVHEQLDHHCPDKENHSSAAQQPKRNSPGPNICRHPNRTTHVKRLTSQQASPTTQKCQLNLCAPIASSA